MQSKSILIADQDMYYRTLIAASLQMVTGISGIMKASTLDVAIGVIKRQKTDIVFLSYDLFGNCADYHLEVLREKSNYETLVILTEGNEDDYIDNSVSALADIIVPKNKLLQPINLRADAIFMFLAERLMPGSIVNAKLYRNR